MNNEISIRPTPKTIKTIHAEVEVGTFLPTKQGPKDFQALMERSALNQRRRMRLLAMEERILDIRETQLQAEIATMGYLDLADAHPQGADEIEEED